MIRFKAMILLKLRRSILTQNLLKGIQSIEVQTFSQNFHHKTYLHIKKFGLC